MQVAQAKKGTGRLSSHCIDISSFFWFLLFLHHDREKFLMSLPNALEQTRLEMICLAAQSFAFVMD